MQKSLMLAALLVSCVAADKTWYFRGTPNEWGATQMILRANDGRFCHTEYFAKNGDKFKISANANNWDEAYPENDWVIFEGEGMYDICYGDESETLPFRRGVRVVKFTSFRGPYLRSTKNNWGLTTPLTLGVSNYGQGTYIRYEDFEAGAEFKVGSTADWNDISLPSSNYVITEAGTYKITYADNFGNPTLSVVKQ